MMYKIVIQDHPINTWIMVEARNIQSAMEFARKKNWNVISIEESIYAQYYKVCNEHQPRYDRDTTEVLCKNCGEVLSSTPAEESVLETKAVEMRKNQEVHNKDIVHTKQ